MIEYIIYKYHIEKKGLKKKGNNKGKNTMFFLNIIGLYKVIKYIINNRNARKDK